MMKKEPLIRFPEFNEKWGEKKIGQLLKIRHGKDQKKIEDKDGLYPILGTGGEIGRTNTPIYEKESVLIGRKGTIDRPFYMETPFWTVDTLFYSEIKPNVEAKYIYYLFQNINWKKYNEASGVPSLSASTIEGIKVMVPNQNEQQKIASFFSLIDKKIEKQREKVEALQLYKKGMLQKVYSQKIRFKDDNGQEFSNWKYDTLGKFANKITKKNKDGKITNVISNSAKEGLIAQRDYFDKDIANIDNIDGYYVIEQGDFVYNPRKSADAPYGPINKYLFKDKGIVSPLYLCFKVSKSIDSDFLAYYFKSDKWHRFIHENSDQGARHDRVSIKDSDFFKMIIPIPEIKEQEKIAKFFRTLDKKIQSEQMRLNILTEWKKGLLQKMFV